MKTIKLRSKKELMFPPFHKGVIEMTIKNVGIDFINKKYDLIIEDSCKVDYEEEIDEVIYPEGVDINEYLKSKDIQYQKKNVIVTKTLGTPNVRISHQTFQNIKDLVLILQESNPKIREVDLDDAIMEAFGQGFYFTTKKEIEVQRLNWYGSKSIQDWELIIE